MKYYHLIIILCVACFFACSKEDETSNIPEKFKDFATVFDGGGIGGIIALSFESHLLISTTGTQYAWFENDKVQKEWNLSDPDGPFRDIASVEIATGMVLQWQKNPNNLFIIYDDGMRYMNCTINGTLDASNNWNDPDFFFSDYRGWQDVKAKWGANGTFPLSDIGACIKTNYMGCLSQIVIASEEFILVDQVGTGITNYIVDGGVSMPATVIENILNYSGAGCPPENYQLPFSQVGAATLYRDSDGKDHVIIFNGDGKTFAFYGENDESMSDAFSF